MERNVNKFRKGGGKSVLGGRKKKKIILGVSLFETRCCCARLTPSRKALLLP